MSDIHPNIDEPMIDYFDDADSAPIEVEPASLERLVLLADKAKDLARQISEMTVALAELQGAHEKLVRSRIPSIMEELALESFKLTSGETIEVKEDIRASISEENRPAAWVWLEAREYDGIIKTAVSVAFGKGEMEAAKKLVADIEALGQHADLNRSVHPMTLKSFVKERLEAGDNLPLDVFSVFEFKEAKFKAPRKSKK